MDAFGCPLPGSDVFEYLEQVGDGRFSEVSDDPYIYEYDKNDTTSCHVDISSSA